MSSATHQWPPTKLLARTSTSSRVAATSTTLFIEKETKVQNKTNANRGFGLLRDPAISRAKNFYCTIGSLQTHDQKSLHK